MKKLILAMLMLIVSNVQAQNQIVTIYFENNKTNINQFDVELLQFMIQEGYTPIKVESHCSKVGSESVNRRISDERLSNTLSILGSVVETHSFSYENATDEAHYRRVDITFMKIKEAPIKTPITLQTASINTVSIPTFSIKQGVDTVEVEYFILSKKEIKAIKKQARKDYKDSLLRADTLQYVKDSIAYYSKLDTSVIIMPTKCDSAYVQVVENNKELLKIIVDSTYEYITVEEQLQGIVPNKSVEKIIKKGLKGKKLTSFRNFFNRLYKKVTSGTTVADKILDSPLLGDGMFSPYGNMNCGGSRSIGRKIVNHAVITVGSLGILPTLHYVELGVKEGIGYIFKKLASIGKKDYKVYKTIVINKKQLIINTQQISIYNVHHATFN